MKKSDGWPGMAEKLIFFTARIWNKYRPKTEARMV
jgi:hypothetical protein